MSGKALAAGIAANPDDQEPVASAIPLTCFSNDAKRVPAMNILDTQHSWYNQPAYRNDRRVAERPFFQGWADDPLLTGQHFVWWSFGGVR